MAFGDNKKKSIEHLIIPDNSLKMDGYSFQKEDKWKLVSHLHKSIRHGKVEEARRAAKWIYTLDSAYARYRMAVIAFEDVAGGSPSVILESMKNGWKKDNIESQGGVDWFSNQAALWADTLKDRTANDWASCSRWLILFCSKYGINELADLSINKAIDIAWDQELSWQERGLAAWRIVGTDKFPNPRLGKFSGDWELWLKLAKDNNISEKIIECMIQGLATQKESSPLFLCFVDKAMQVETVEEITKKYIDLPNIGPYCSSSIDKHTSEGKQAINHYVRNNKKLLTFMEKKGCAFENAVEMTGRIQFWFEGGVLNKTLKYKTANVINNDLKFSFIKDFNIDPREFYRCVNDFENWHKSRKYILEKKKF